MKNKKLKVYDTVNKRYKVVEVSDEIYKNFNRTSWNISDNDKSFFKHEIQFSSLYENTDNIERFSEFLDKRDSVEDIIAYRLENERLHKCLSKLKDEEKQIIDMLYFENKTERQVAEILKTTQQNLHKKKLRILRKIKIFLENA